MLIGAGIGVPGQPQRPEEGQRLEGEEAGSAYYVPARQPPIQGFRVEVGVTSERKSYWRGSYTSTVESGVGR